MSGFTKKILENLGNFVGEKKYEPWLPLLVTKWTYLVTCVCVYIYRDSALQQTIYMMLIGYADFIMVGVLVLTCLILIA